MAHEERFCDIPLPCRSRPSSGRGSSSQHRRHQFLARNRISPLRKASIPRILARYNSYDHPIRLSCPGQPRSEIATPFPTRVYEIFLPFEASSAVHQRPVENSGRPLMTAINGAPLDAFRLGGPLIHPVTGVDVDPIGLTHRCSP
ncbi:hypothetical protein IV203_007664 [Nitzschia inconspicua]|uniref:Uncharacterized protein n=1 Tax=Nitzschia inconspicua TaxID=303405 RepID=A0A9K3KG50_9STRA|nr:hypothetical protein IV203_007664 [Nitzschia inconspicua]